MNDECYSFSYLTPSDNVKNFDKNNLLICIIVTTWTIPVTFNSAICVVELAIIYKVAACKIVTKLICFVGGSDNDHGGETYNKVV